MSIIPFQFQDREVRVIERDSEPWFVLVDLCKVLELTNPTVVSQRIDPQSLSQAEVLDARGVSHPTTIVSESGMYEVVIRSDKPEAIGFRRWVTAEVIPSIRKRGMYATPDTVEKMLADPDVMIQALTSLKEERARRAELETQAAANHPKVIFADAVAASHTSILVGDLAKVLRGNGVQVGGTRLFRILRDRGYLIRREGSDWNMPTQRSMELGLFEVKETAITHSDGHVTISKTPKVTGKGQQYFVDRFLAGSFDDDEQVA